MHSLWSLCLSRMNVALSVSEMWKEPWSCLNSSLIRWVSLGQKWMKKSVFLFPVCSLSSVFYRSSTSWIFNSSLTQASQAPDPITRSLLLAISVCYHARLQEREDYEKDVTAQFIAPLSLPGGAAQFRNEVHWYLPNQHFTLHHINACRNSYHDI